MSKETTKKEPMSVVKKMMIALVGGLVVGIGFLLLRQHLTTSGNEAAWTVINKLLFQDITVEEGVGAVGIFYIVGQVFMRGLQPCAAFPTLRNLEGSPDVRWQDSSVSMYAAHFLDAR